jgi:hypothetical protein
VFYTIAQIQAAYPNRCVPHAFFRHLKSTVVVIQKTQNRHDNTHKTPPFSAVEVNASKHKLPRKIPTERIQNRIVAVESFDS